MQENKFLQQNWLLSPASCKAEKEKRDPSCSAPQRRHRGTSCPYFHHVHESFPMEREPVPSGDFCRSV